MTLLYYTITLLYYTIVSEPPKVQFDRLYPSGLQIRVGATQTVSATYSGLPAPAVTWYKDGKPLSSSQAKVDVAEFSTYLAFSGIDVDASGNYRVVVENDAGSSSADVYINVRGESTSRAQSQLIQCFTINAMDNLERSCGGSLCVKRRTALLLS